MYCLSTLPLPGFFCRRAKGAPILGLDFGNSAALFLITPDVGLRTLPAELGWLSKGSLKGPAQERGATTTKVNQSKAGLSANHPDWSRLDVGSTCLPSGHGHLGHAEAVERANPFRGIALLDAHHQVITGG